MLTFDILFHTVALDFILTMLFNVLDLYYALFTVLCKVSTTKILILRQDNNNAAD